MSEPKKAIDPRVAKRRRNVSRERMRRRRRIVVRVGLVLLATAALVGLTLSPVLAVRQIEVRGFKETTAASVGRASGLSTGHQPMISIDRVAIARRVERLPWVERVTVTRRWPNRVRISITERVPLAHIAVPGGVALLDRTGRVLAIVQAAPAGVTALEAPGKVPAPGGVAGSELRAVLGVADAIPSALLRRTTVVRRSATAPATFELALSGGVTVRLGDANDLAAKMGAAQAVLGKADAPGVTIDVRVAASPTVTRGKAS